MKSLRPNPSFERSCAKAAQGSASTAVHRVPYNQLLDRTVKTWLRQLSSAAQAPR